MESIRIIKEKVLIGLLICIISSGIIVVATMMSEQDGTHRAKLTKEQNIGWEKVFEYIEE